MKRDIIYGPHELGGLNFLDLKVDQLAQRTLKLIDHGRKGGIIGNIILSYQLHLGTEARTLKCSPIAKTEKYILHHIPLGRTTSNTWPTPNSYDVETTQI